MEPSALRDIHQPSPIHIPTVFQVYSLQTLCFSHETKSSSYPDLKDFFIQNLLGVQYRFPSLIAVNH